MPNLESCHCMRILHLVELALGQLILNHTWLGVAVLVWALACCLTESTIMTSGILLLHVLLHLQELAFGELSA